MKKNRRHQLFKECNSLKVYGKPLHKFRSSCKEFHVLLMEQAPHTRNTHTHTGDRRSFRPPSLNVACAIKATRKLQTAPGVRICSCCRSGSTTGGRSYFSKRSVHYPPLRTIQLLCGRKDCEDTQLVVSLLHPTPRLVSERVFAIL